MQSINAGFHTLRVLMPHLQGEKLSKVERERGREGGGKGGREGGW